MGNDDNPFKGALADKLADLDIEVRESDANEAQSEGTHEKSAPAESAKNKSAKNKSFGARAPEQTPRKSDEELFVEALEGIDRGDVFRGKYGVPGDDWQPGQDAIERAAEEVEAQAGPDVDDDEMREQVKELQDKHLLEHFVGQMDERYSGSKYRQKQRRTSAEEPEKQFSTPSLPRDGEGLREVQLESAQRKLLDAYNKHARKTRIPEINIRGDHREEAIERLDTFLPNCHQRGDRFVRIICGRGKNSEGDPILKPTVIEWIETTGKTMVKGYAPEVLPSGDYGSIIVEFESKS